MADHPVATAVVALVMVFAIGAAVDLARIRADVDDGSTTLADLSLEGLGAGLVETVGGAAERLVHADAVADRSPFLAPLSVLPVIGDQVDGLRDLTDAGAQIGRSARQASLAIDEDLERAGAEPAARLDLLETVTDELDRMEREIADLDLGDDEGLIGPLSRAHDQLVDELDRVPERFDEARGHIEALGRLLRGPTRYLVLAANNAEMRGGAGMPLSGGVVTFLDGDVTFGEFQSLANRHVPGVGELVPEEYEQTYHNFKVGRSWLQTAVSPNFTTTGPIYAAMSAQFPLGPVDGVLEVDVVALGELLAVIGPVELDGFTYTADNIEAQLLNENYLRFADATHEARSERLEVQGELAGTIFEALKERNVAIADLALRLRDAAESRHLLAWARDPAVQELWEKVGATGALHHVGLMVTVQNIAANKLDWYIEPDVAITSSQYVHSGAWRVRLSVSFANPHRERSSPAVESARPETEYRDGMHRALVAVYLPASAREVESEDLPFSELGADPPMRMVGKRVFVAEGEDTTLTIKFSMPARYPGVLVLPSGRVHPMQYMVNGVRFTDARPTLALWSPPTATDDQRTAAGVAGALALTGAATMLVGARGRLQLAGHGPGAHLSEPIRRAPVLGLALLAAALVLLAAGTVVDVA